ncbi:central kinetochore associated family protein [Schizosaccharomyces cryophilus OY26]|uniref:Central kinetochore associated family protein n=1 Tax=Schizosaccharomyces cryophilus (strain OY26 / ATCC MYA-4695 / CBS 11777 / NBRC 106824 / NRRL Y48691) TaxID=653667 RepID=S9W0S8_SCHCR|nr:central kinetochore associated family protein [Schizosaccharomyces cryophilus OY26]EPY52024.1 central kinetochore associated family protein [Schizosaccharomyces cryophilus OY26]
MDWKKSVQKATALTIETNDYVSYCTMVEMLLEKNLTRKEEDQLDLLRCLNDELRKPEYDQLTKEIAWDVLGMLLPYVNGCSSEEAVKFMRFLAEKGNPKEVFLKSNEILTNMMFQNLSQFEVTVDSMNSAINRIETNKPLVFLDSYIVSLYSGITRILLVKEANRFRIWDMCLDSIGKITRRFGKYSECHLNLMAAFTIFLQLFLSSECLFFSFRELLNSKHPHVEFRKNRFSYDVQQLQELDSFLVRLLDIFDELCSMGENGWEQLVKRFYVQIMNLDSAEGSICNQEEEEQEEDMHQKVMIDNKGCVALLTIRSFYRERSFLQDLFFNSKEHILLDSLFTLMSIEGNPEASGFTDLALYQTLLLSKFIIECSAEDHERFFSLLQIYQYFSAFSSEPWIRLIANDIVFHLLDSVSPDIRFKYVLDTLEECPFVNVKASILNYYQKNGLLSKPVENNPFFLKKNLSTVLKILFDDLFDLTADPLSLIYLQQALIFLYYLKFQNCLDYNDQVLQFLKRIENFVQQNEEKVPNQNLTYYLELLQPKN